LFLQDIHTKIFAEKLQDMIFDTEIVTALHICALYDSVSQVRSSAVNFFTTATAQGEPYYFHGIFILNSPQLDLDARYLV